MIVTKRWKCSRGSDTGKKLLIKGTEIYFMTFKTAKVKLLKAYPNLEGVVIHQSIERYHVYINLMLRKGVYFSNLIRLKQQKSNTLIPIFLMFSIVYSKYLLAVLGFLNNSVYLISSSESFSPSVREFLVF